MPSEKFGVLKISFLKKNMEHSYKIKECEKNLRSRTFSLEWKSKTRVTSSEIWVTSSNLRVASSNPRVTSSNPRVTVQICEP